MTTAMIKIIVLDNSAYLFTKQYFYFASFLVLEKRLFSDMSYGFPYIPKTN